MPLELIGSSWSVKKCQKGFVRCSISPETAASKNYASLQCLNSCLSVTGAAKEAENDAAPGRNLHGIDESSQKFQQLEDKRPFLPMEEEEEEEETAVNIPPEDEEATFSDNREAEDGYGSERGLPLADPFGAADAGESAKGDTAPGNLLQFGCFVILLLKRSMAE